MFHRDEETEETPDWLCELEDPTYFPATRKRRVLDVNTAPHYIDPDLSLEMHGLKEDLFLLPDHPNPGRFREEVSLIDMTKLRFREGLWLCKNSESDGNRILFFLLFGC